MTQFDRNSVYKRHHVQNFTVNCQDPLLYQSIRRNVITYIQWSRPRTLIEWHLVLSFVVKNEAPCINKFTLQFLSSPRVLRSITHVCSQFDLAFDEIVRQVDDYDYDCDWYICSIECVTVHIADIL